ncbi:MAG: hypothetical protein GF353_17685 [Candidatus Lokiarchaeota archaeon]|nr:hypothetical protein [Candidatus Lokiarchaeota archaeon]
MSWALWILASLIPLFKPMISFQFSLEILSFTANLCIVYGIMSFALGIIANFISPNLRLFIGFAIAFFITTVTLFLLLGLGVVSIFTAITSLILLILCFGIPLSDYRVFIKNVGKSKKWFYSAAIVNILGIPANLFLLFGFSSEYRTSILYTLLNYGFYIIGAIFLIAFLLHLEYNITNTRKEDLIDRYSHRLGNILQTLYSIRFIKENPELYNLTENKEKETELMDLEKEKLQEASELIEEIRNL